MEKKKILCLFDYMATTGFATVSQNIVPRIKKHFGENLELHICSINYFGDTIYEEDGTIIFSAIKSAPKKDDFGRFGFLKILKDSEEYDGIFIIQDLGVILPIIEILKTIKEEKKRENKRNFKSIFYFPVDCSLIRKQVEKLEFFDTLITYTEFGRNEVLKLRPELKGKLKVIPHGTDTKNFHPIDLDEVANFRKEYFGANADKFIIMNLNRNQPRKDIPNTIFGFIEAKKNWHKDSPKPFLYLHCNPTDPMGHDLRAVLLQTDLVEWEDYMFPSKEEENHGSPLEKLNKIYNSADLYVTTTLGEGWGLGFTEASATRCPIICPYNSSFMEMSGNGDRAFILEESVPFVNSIDNIVRQQTNYLEVSESILHVSGDLLGKNEDLNGLENSTNRIDKAFEWAMKLKWDEVCKSWYEYFKTTFGVNK
jgi:glycosyltransferase involved in cell wall biosynthesis